MHELLTQKLKRCGSHCAAPLNDFEEQILADMPMYCSPLQAHQQVLSMRLSAPEKRAFSAGFKGFSLEKSLQTLTATALAAPVSIAAHFSWKPLATHQAQPPCCLGV